MAIKLNAVAYKEFYGSNLEQMPKLIAECRSPMNVSQLMQRRLDFRNGPQDVKTAWMDNYFDTGDAVVYHPDGSLLIIPDSLSLREMNPQSQLRNRVLLLDKDKDMALALYNHLKNCDGVLELKKGKVGKTETALTREEAKASPVWKALARDKSLLADYVDFIFAEGKQRFNYDNAMGVYMGSCGGDAPEMRAFCVDGLDLRSLVCGRVDLVNDIGRLVGVAPEALGGASAKGVSAVQRYTMADLQTLDKIIGGLEGTLHPDKLKPLVEFRKKL